jgi:phosphoglycolate phosphatase-like HAD superfamily hydrolase
MSRVVLFDLDGTLLDSRPAVLAAYAEAASAFEGGAERLAAIPVGELLAMRVVESGAVIAGAGDAEALVRLYDEAYRLRTYTEVTLYDGVVPMLRALVDSGFALGVVTNKGLSRTPGDVAPLDGGTGGEALFEVIVTADDSVERKPSPRPMEIALERGGWRAEDAVYIGDGPHDHESASSAGMAFIGAGWGYYGPDALSNAGAEHVLETPSALPASIARLFRVGDTPSA